MTLPPPANYYGEKPPQLSVREKRRRKKAQALAREDFMKHRRVLINEFRERFPTNLIE